TILGDRLEVTRAVDSGPGKALINEAISPSSNRKKTYDKRGAAAKRGTLNKDLVRELLSHSYFRRRAPKSTGREHFGSRMAEDIIARCHDLPQEDILSTLTHLTATTIVKSIAAYKPVQLIAAGGGSKILFLMGILRELLLSKGVELRNVGEYGIDAEAREAVCFAILGMRTLKRMPGNLPSATGAARQVILGSISLPG
ncbi:MAG: anhydro-N-acetylmuramic acid kinase, partial [Nitrospirae bacterium]|nr:anhydro-N-acetylmuramic acid kinase [Nitrospirota bacterium]